MKRIVDDGRFDDWLFPLPPGPDTSHWEAETWILHPVWENWTLKSAFDLDDADEPGAEPAGDWRLVTWREFLARYPDHEPDRRTVPSTSWFPDEPYGYAVLHAEGTLDLPVLRALLSTLAEKSGRASGPCFAYYGMLLVRMEGAEENNALWRGSLADVPAMLEVAGGPYPHTPTALWPEDRSWFVWTDHDHLATRVNGSRELIDAIKAHPELETIDWPIPED